TDDRRHLELLPVVHPHVRGAHSWWISTATSAPRSIPTCVGLTQHHSVTPAARTVHPHVRGAHDDCGEMFLNVRGPSPRAWGSPWSGRRCTLVRRSIPTCVGLTGRMPRSTSWTTGPSPRAWGSRCAQRPQGLPPRSIPTCVGLTMCPT